MKIAVIAANGRTGKAFVELALRAGHTVAAGVYSTNTFSDHANLKVQTCDARNEDDVNRLIKDCDAVASFIGHVKGSPVNVQTDAMKVLVSAMNAHGITRLVSLTGTGVRFPGDKITMIDRILNLSIGLIDPARVNDGKKHVAFLQQSSLDWTIIRVLKLQNTKPKPFSLQQYGPTKLYVSRDEVAVACLQVLEQGSFIHQAPIISSPSAHL